MIGTSVTSEETITSPSKDQGWLEETEIRPSSLEAAGNGRYLVNIGTGTAVCKGSTMCKKRCIYIGHVDSLSALTKNMTLQFKQCSDVEKFVSLCEEERGWSRARALELIAHFMWSYDGTSTFLNLTTWTTNHSPSPNLAPELVTNGPDLKAINFVAVMEIETGDELLIDYREFNFPTFFKEYASENGFQDVRTAVMDAVSWTEQS